jgi:hypothetical protein
MPLKQKKKKKKPQGSIVAQTAKEWSKLQTSTNFPNLKGKNGIFPSYTLLLPPQMSHETSEKSNEPLYNSSGCM